jgi:hypothetical protein
MLETIREDALERLQDADEEVHARNRHLAFFLAAAEAAPQLSRVVPPSGTPMKSSTCVSVKPSN